MTDSPFLDTNILVYAFDKADLSKQERAIAVLEGRVYKGQPVISTQVIQEFYVTVVRKLSRPLAEDKAFEACVQLAKFPVVQIETNSILSAIRISQRYQLSLWDSLIVEAARLGGCRWLVTEDLQDGFELEGLTVINPFL